MLWSLLFISLLGGAHLSSVPSIYACNGNEIKLKGTAPLHQPPDACKGNKIKLKGRLTSQSSNYKPTDTRSNLIYSADRAVDGDLENCAHTETVKDSWWSVDLGDVYSISCIAIYNKNQSNINMCGSVVYIGNSTYSSKTSSVKCTTIGNFKIGEQNYFECDGAVMGRYVNVSSPQKKHVVLCEVEIYGGSPFELVKEKMTWEDALYYCRNNKKDLAPISDDTKYWAEMEARKADTEFVWVGLHYTCTLGYWFWVSGHNFKVNKWGDSITDSCFMSAVMDKQGSWFRKNDNNMFNFICTK